MPVYSNSRAVLCGLLALAVGLGAQPALAAFANDPYNSVVVAPSGFNTMFGSAATDGSGGMLIAWQDGRAAGLPHLYVQRYTGTGAVAAGWPAGGLLVSGTTGSQTGPVLLGDGAGGAIVAWNDHRGATQDIYASRLLANGTLAPGWPANGLLVSVIGVSPTVDDYNPVIATDGAGGAFICWTAPYGPSDYDLYGAHVTSAGGLPWNGGLYTPFGHQSPQRVISDAAGGFIVGFADDENTATYRVKVERFNSGAGVVWGPTYFGTGSNGQSNLDLATDGAGGVFAVCTDNGPLTYQNISANHFMANGVNDPNWGGYKFIAPEANLSQGSPLALADGSGGLLTAYFDTRYGAPVLFAQRTGAYAVPYTGWPAGGVALGAGAGLQYPASIVSDGAGGAVVTFFSSGPGGEYFVYAARVLGNGLLAPGWAYGGNPVDLGGLTDIGLRSPATVADGSGGALFAWADTRGTTGFGNAGVYAQDMDRFGALGDARPFITRIADVPNDQGGSVSLQWTASYLDAFPSRTVTQYSIWRRVPGGVAAASPARASATDGGPALRTTVEGAQVIYWEYVSTEPARMLPGYSVVVHTTSDSMTAGNPKTSLMVFAESPGAIMFWQSPPDSGYSLDNLPPYAPAPFLGTYSAGLASLHWRANGEADLAGYRLYRGGSASFTPGPASLVVALVDTAYADAAGSPHYYRLTAIDVHGDESVSTLLLPSGTLAVDGGTLPLEVALSRPQPNPARGATTLRFALPRDAAVRLVLFDASGRRVRVLMDGVSVAGEHSVTWDLRDGGGRAVGAGLYFARLEADGRAVTQRVMALR